MLFKCAALSVIGQSQSVTSVIMLLVIIIIKMLCMYVCMSCKCKFFS